MGVDFAKPPRLLAGVTLVWLLFVLAMSSDAGMGILGFFTVIYGGLALTALFVVRVLAFLAARRRFPPGASLTGWAWGTVPAAILLGAVAGVLLEGPASPLFRIRFHLSESALRERAEAMLVDTARRTSAGSRVGLFFVMRIDTYERQVRFITTPCGVVDACGMVYVPAGTHPARLQEDRFSRLTDRWWHVYEGF